MPVAQPVISHPAPGGPSRRNSWFKALGTFGVMVLLCSGIIRGCSHSGTHTTKAQIDAAVKSGSDEYRRGVKAASNLVYDAQLVHSDEFMGPDRLAKARKQAEEAMDAWKQTGEPKPSADFRKGFIDGYIYNFLDE